MHVTVDVHESGVFEVTCTLRMHWQLPTAARQLSAPTAPVHMVQSPQFLLRKQEARRNLCPTQWLVLAAEV